MSDYKKWLDKKGLTSSVAAGTDFRMSKGLDPTDAQYKKLGLNNPGPPGGDPAQADTIPDRATVQKAVAKYSQNLDKKAKSPVRGMKSIGHGPNKIPAGPLGKLASHLGVQPQAPDTLVKDLSGNVLSASGASAGQAPPPDPAAQAALSANAEHVREQAALKDSGFSNNVWKPGPGNKSKAMAQAAHSFPMKYKKVK